MSDQDIIIEVNGQKLPQDTFKVVKFLNGDIKVEIVYHNQEGYFKEHIQENPEQFGHEDHSALFTEEEKINLSQSMRG